MKHWIAAPLLLFGFALPTDVGAHPYGEAEAFSQAISVYRHAEDRARLGVGVVEMTPELRSFFGAPKDVGILVSQIEDESPASAARIRVGDVIVSVAGEDVADVGDVRRALDARDGDKVKVMLVRKKKRVRKTVKLDAPDRGFAPPPPDRPRSQALEKELQRTRKQLRSIEKRLDKLERKKRKPSK